MCGTPRRAHDRTRAPGVMLACRCLRASCAALAARHIRSVYVTQESVFSSDTADDLALVLQAVIEPGNEAALRTALATRLLQATVSEIAGLNQTAQQHHALLEEFRAYHERWTKLGVAAMLDAMTRRRQAGDALGIVDKCLRVV